MIITALRSKNYRNFNDISFTLGDRVFLVGPNASGKSNLLDIFRFFHDLTSIGGGIQKAIQMRGGFFSLRSLSAG
jgi:predicted ATPase